MTMDLRDNFLWCLFEDTEVAAEKSDQDHSAEAVLEELHDPSRSFGKLYPENEKLQVCTSVNLIVTLCAHVSKPPPPPLKERSEEIDLNEGQLEFLTCPRSIAFFAALGTSEAIALGRGML
ncbi:uncharacterized protein N7496_005199 [Penicillium cataractarum]|uniref:Uncharacterized protein n=1 Tax=Penicillium cataractarum TaxID=2100454 RepID=A0A9W9SGU9_9EURO|nr:uncharacterized protein N7496_005199 [Penicillium cataractarum]KAJ5377790.1 hypothetical protein N7496_005199 [Penicillium cataractarum]